MSLMKSISYIRQSNLLDLKKLALAHVKAANTRGSLFGRIQKFMLTQATDKDLYIKCVECPHNYIRSIMRKLTNKHVLPYQGMRLIYRLICYKTFLLCQIHLVLHFSMG